MLGQHPEYLPNMQKYFTHLETRCTRLNYMRQMFEGGKSKDDVLGGMIAMHKPESYWQQKSKEAVEAGTMTAQEQSSNPSLPRRTATNQGCSISVGSSCTTSGCPITHAAAARHTEPQTKPLSRATWSVLACFSACSSCCCSSIRLLIDIRRS